MPVINELTPVRAGSIVPPHYVHKRDESEVLVTGWESFRPDTFVVSVRWPTRHRFYLSQNGRHDPMLFTESVRQCFPLLSHAGYGLPFGHHLIWQYVTSEVVPSAMRTGQGPTELELYITCSDIRYRGGGQLAALTLHVIALRGGEHLGTAEARFSCHAPSIYRRLRGPYADLQRAVAAAGAPPPPVLPSRVARDREDNVVLSPTEHHRRWTLRNDTSHPVLFDHPLDHSPGMLVLEAARQATHAVCGANAYPFRMESSFLQFTELDAPCRLSAEPEPTRARDQQKVQVLASQGDDTTFTSVLTALVGSPAAR
ncbi:ScbA/BarX family gamma-butyrolactone biosynthesis protein [Streptomyces sp. DG2A-72]|uniref:ScbA/BarX family gamma-butyrolactone biosynthesis protein n=1 Tax=Streptomyces sp. DG2A-72 TaxID=3051386 RepID=UPI00265B9E60|nr:ScbA/BarX family gamma-butyrolactone biosynthesis protein [Streptomyces sp. DG2A-72]MDO0939389.1 ScbA/BarX family gamma-butyrolactone biosynthesis protein [Streptomyces sp. DG2A-72]